MQKQAESTIAGAAEEPRLWFGYLLNQIGHRIRLATAEALAPLGINPPLLRLLGIIAVDQPLTQTQLGLRAGMDRTTITKFVDRMEALGLAVRTPDQADRRAHAVVLTSAGRTALAAGTTEADAVQSRLLSGLSAGEQAQLITLLARVHGGHANICPNPDQEEPIT